VNPPLLDPINEGTAILANGLFVDPGADTWTATVDYGDGSGLQPLALNPDKTFALSHVYADGGVFTVTVTVTDDDGGSGSDTTEVTVHIPVNVDIKPGSFPNSINPRNKGVIPVAILGSARFDVTRVNPLSVRFRPGAATEVHNRGHLEDVNRDGLLDLVLHFSTEAAGLTCGMTSASLIGSTTDGITLVGSDSVQIVPCR